MKTKNRRLTEVCTRLRQFCHQIKLYLSSCILCRGQVHHHPMICQNCHNDLPYFLYPQDSTDLLQWPAIDKVFTKRHFDHLFCLTPYVKPLDHWLKQLKYHNQFELSDLLGFLLAQRWLAKSPTIKDATVMAVPMPMRKWQQRGYNQAHLIARSFCQYTQLSYDSQYLIRTKEHQSQVGKSGRQRRKNLQQAFAVSSRQKPTVSHVLLIDDVITTGSTVNTISKLLKKQGVQQVTVVTVALSLPI